MNPTKTVIGARVRALRTKRGWSLDTLSARTHLHKSYLSRIETGPAEPPAETIRRLAKGLKVRPGSLFEAA